MPDFKTVEGMDVTDPLIRKQKEDVAKMRASLLACSSDLNLASKALTNITVLRIYHQISRIIRYIELMDKVEEKLYEAIENRLDDCVGSPSDLMTLLSIQSRLQENMIASHKLLEPYINISEAVKTISVQSEVVDNAPSMQLLDDVDRNRLRIAAQTILSEIESGKIS